MQVNNLAKLESDIALKKDYLNKTGWWKTTRLIPPVLFLFIGLAGLLYLVKTNMLLSIYAIPFVLLFAIATVWLKTVKKYIITTKVETPGSFLVCMGKPVRTTSRYVYVVFVTSAKRHYGHFISTFAKELPQEAVEDACNQDARQAIKLYDEASETTYYIKAIKEKELYKQNRNRNEGDCIPVIYIDEKHVYPVRRKYL